MTRFNRFPKRQTGARPKTGRLPSFERPGGHIQALGQLPFGAMNKTEAAYEEHLYARVQAGEVQWFKFEAVKLRLADNTFYTCDFIVVTKTGHIEMHEVKGFWQDTARVKIKVAASIYPFKFVAVKKKTNKDGGGWSREEF